MIKRRRSKGFTLLELMVALSILAVTFASLMREGAQVAKNTKIIKDKTIAHWIAMNKMVELGMDTNVNKTYQRISTDTEDVEMAGVNWQMEIEVTATPNEFVRKVDITVNDSQGRPVTTLTSMLRNPKP